jgi:hypothetical protein
MGAEEKTDGGASLALVLVSYGWNCISLVNVENGHGTASIPSPARTSYHDLLNYDEPAS